MRKFNVTINGKAYEVEIEELSAGCAVAQKPVETKPIAVKEAPKPAPAPQAAAPVAPANGTTVKAPMPGLILNLCVANGSAVKKGDKILVLEAMKMENDIVAECDGTVSFIVKKGDSVESGASLAVIG